MRNAQDKILTKKEVAARLRLRSTTSIDDMIRAGEFIPGFRRGLRRVGWFESEVNAWLAARVDERNSLMAQILAKAKQRKEATSN
ncbi:AlpA family phage regulatory protein [Salmonella enterica]|nr:AlpA family phage regulatory protein [Salmonella enterica]ELR6434848.1 AlpA family phage regulatory protein [Salmonella enterica]